MPFEYLELTRRQLADRSPSKPPVTQFTSRQRVQLEQNRHNAYGNVKQALDELGAADWELVSVVSSPDHGGELLYTFKK